MINCVTFAIVSFNRPANLSRLLASIDEHYPDARVVIAENGLTGWWSEPLHTRDGKRDVWLLPFDVGCSATRNFLVNRCETEYILFLEEDFVFTEKTKIEPLIEILDGDNSIGMAGGFVDPGGKPAVIEQRDGYYISGTLRMFAVCRMEMFDDHRFDELLKTGEHGPFMTEVKLADKWKFAFCESTSIKHEKITENHGFDYAAYRGRAKDLKAVWKARMQLEEYLKLKKDKATRSLFGRSASHMFGHGDILFLDLVLSRNKKWTNCVELGTGSGLTTLYLAISFMIRGGEVFTCDMRRKPVGTYHDYFPANVTFNKIDILTAPHPGVIDRLSRPNTFAFFDNGNKRQEVEMYAQYLPVGSGLIVHDWPKEFGPDDVPGLTKLGFESYGPSLAEMLQSACRCFIRKDHPHAS